MKSGLIAYFPFSGNVSDSSGNNVVSDLQGSVTLTNDRFGKNSSAYLFSAIGFNGRSRIMGNLKTPLGNNFSISFWAKRNSIQPTGSSVDDKEWMFFSGVRDLTNTNNTLYQPMPKEYENKTVVFGIPNGSSVLVYGSIPNPTNSNYAIDNSWRHYAQTYINGEFRIYINGKLISSTQKSINILDTFFIIGNIGDYSREGFNGAIDDVRIYNNSIPLNVIEYLSKN